MCQERPAGLELLHYAKPGQILWFGSCHRELSFFAAEGHAAGRQICVQKGRRANEQMVGLGFSATVDKEL